MCRAAANTTTARGKLRTKISRHETPVTSAPPARGPMAPATPPSPDQVPIARPRSSAQKLDWMMDRLPGTRSAPPMPWSVRAAMSTPSVGETAQSSDAALNQTTPIRNTRRRPKMSPSDPPMRMSADRVMR